MIPCSRLMSRFYRKWLVAAALLLSTVSSVFSQTPEFRGVWVDAWGTGFLNGAQVDNLVNHCRTYNFNAVIVQMRRRGDAFYMPQAPNLEPRTTALASGYDALQDLITKCNSGSPKIEVHCWTPTHLVGDSGSVGNANHVMNLHPEYMMRNSTNGMLIGEGYYLDPGHPSAQQWNYNMAMDIVSRYNIDGFHWDYIRYPQQEAGYNATAVARYNAEYGLTGQPLPTDSQFSTWRRRQVTDFLRWANADLLAVKPNLVISASVFASRSDAFNARFQDWAAWNNEGLLDICFPMNYTDNNTTFNTRVNDSVANQGVRRVYVGPGAYLNTKENTVTQLQYVRAQGLLGTSLYSYRTPNSGTVDQTGTFAHVHANYQPTWVNTPTLPWKVAPTKGIVKGIVTGPGSAPLYNATVSINTSPVRTIKTDAHGSYAFYETVPGTYTLTASGTGMGSVSDSATVSVGTVVTLNLVFPNDATAPVISGVAANGVTDSSATIVWSTDENSSSIVEYGTTLSYGSLASSTNRVANHSIPLSGLSPSTTYQFRVRSTDANTNEAVSANFSFTTNPSGVVNDLIIEGRIAGGSLNSNPPYTDTGLANSTLKSAAAGLTGTGSRYAETSTPTITITPTLSLAGATYDVFMTHGVATSISDDVIVSVGGSGSTGLPATTTIFQESGGNTWELLGRMKLNAGVASPTLLFSKSGGTVAAGSRMYSDSIKFVYVPTAPVFDAQPQNQTVNYGAVATFSVQASGTAPLSYQWKKGVTPLVNGPRISGANSGVLSISNVTGSDVDNYSVTVSNGVGSTNSAVASLTVIDPAIISQPANATNTINSSALFTVGATGTPLLTYQWRKGGIPLVESPKFSGTATASLAINSLTLADAGGYSVVVQNGSGSVTSVVATLVVSASPVFTSQPQSQTVSSSSPASFSVSVEGASPFTYRWQKNEVDLSNGGNVSGATSSTLLLSPAALADAAGYRVVVTNSFGSITSQVATLTVISPPIITAQPTTQTNRGGSTATFNVAVNGTAPFSYQWHRNGQPLSNGGNISGASTASLSVGNVSQADAVAYYVVISNTAGTVTSATVSLVVRDGDATVLYDTFESGNMNNWTRTSATVGTELISDATQNADPASGGSRSAKMDNSLDRMHRNIITDNGGSELSGGSRVTFYIYDSAASRIFSEVRGYTSSGLPNGGITPSGSLSQIIAAGKYNATDNGEVFDPTKYQARVLAPNTLGWFNLNAPGAPSRSAGWHKFEIERLANGTTIQFYVDGILSRTVTATAHNWDTIILGPGLGSTAGDAWIDGFKVERYGTTPAFTVSPQNVLATTGDSVSFNAMVVGNGPFTFQWKRGTTSLVNDGRISGASSLNLTIVGVTTADAGSYTLFASNADGNNTSSAAVLTVSDIAPQIVQHPASLTNNAETVATFSVQANGTSLQYEWFKDNSPLTDGGAIAGCTTATLIISDVQQADGGSYHVRVFNSAGTVESSAATLTVIDPPVLTLHPISQIKNAGQSVTFSAAASGTDVSFQWSKNGNVLVSGGNVSGATTATLIIANLLSADAGSYTVVAVNSAGSDSSEAASLVVNDPIITSQPVAQRVNPGASTSFSVSAFGTEVLTYQWKKEGEPLVNGGKISGANTTTLSISDVQAADLAGYSVTVSSEAGGSVTSSNALLEFTTPPTITTHPQSGAFALGGTATFSVIATGDGPFVYQWKKGGVNLVNGGRISGATSQTLTLFNIAFGDVGAYTVRVSNGAGFDLSDEAILTVSDTVDPLVKLIVPGSNQRLLENVHVTSYVTTVSGTASDNVGLDRVMYSLNDAAFVNAVGTSNWSASVGLKPGTNSIVVRSHDIDGRVSLPLARKFVYVVTSPLTAVVKGGPGFIANNLHGQMLEVGKNYKLTAGILGTNFIFTNWTQIAAGVTNHSSANPLTFEMKSNLVLEANFIVNPFMAVSGSYSGLFEENSGAKHKTAGLIMVKVTPKMAFSGKVLVDGNALSISGKFNLEGEGFKEVSRLKYSKTNLQVNLSLDFANPQDLISGIISSSNHWTAPFEAGRYLWSTSNIPTKYTNNYTMMIPGFANSNAGPVGSGYGLVQVTPVGRLKFAGGTADGHVLKQTAYLSKDGEWPLYVPLYPELKTNINSQGVESYYKEFQGSIMGWVTFATNTPAGKTNLAPQGLLNWTKVHWTNNVHTSGFTNAVNILGSRHLAPAKGVRVLNTPSVRMILSEGNLLAPFTNNFVMTTNSALTVVLPEINELDPSITLKTGLIRGTFTHPNNGNVITRFFGVTLQDYNYGRGYFVGPTKGGAVTLSGN